MQFKSGIMHRYIHDWNQNTINRMSSLIFNFLLLKRIRGITNTSPVTIIMSATGNSLSSNDAGINNLRRQKQYRLSEI